jgi:hypothetical protein
MLPSRPSGKWTISANTASGRCASSVRKWSTTWRWSAVSAWQKRPSKRAPDGPLAAWNHTRNSPRSTASDDVAASLARTSSASGSVATGSVAASASTSAGCRATSCSLRASASESSRSRTAWWGCQAADSGRGDGRSRPCSSGSPPSSTDDANPMPISSSRTSTSGTSAPS